MADIFISYSRKDSGQALELAERLRVRGIDVWIDKSGIEPAKSWSKEIVRAIDDCKAFVVLISANSQESANVSREVGIASESKKPMLPIALEDIKLSDELRYHLSGIQRVAYTQFDAIAQALRNFGIHPPPAPPASGRGENSKLFRSRLREGLGEGVWDQRKSLMILPFQDLSPTGDNGWFADGIVSELISAISNVRALRVLDAQATKDYKRYQGTLPNYAREMQIRYFVEGDVRKFGDNIKITSRLLDIETGDHLWQDSMKGTMQDIFDIQEKVAEKVVEGLKIHLASDEKEKLSERGTSNIEAYELYLKALEYYSRHTRENYRLAVQQFTLSLDLDPNYTEALRYKAIALSELYRQYERDPNLLAEAEQLVTKALEINPHLWSAYEPLSNIYRLQGKIAEAEKVSKEFVQREPESFISHFVLGFFYEETGQPALAIPPWEKALELKPDHLMTYGNLVTVSDRAHDAARVEKWSRTALPLYERRLRLVPDDENARVNYATMLGYANEPVRAIDALAHLLQKQDLDGFSLYNIACLYTRLNDQAHALEALRRSLGSGFRNVELFRTDPDLNQLRELPEFKQWMKELESSNA